MVRAEPITALYDDGKIHHVGAFRRWRMKWSRSRRSALWAHPITPMR